MNDRSRRPATAALVVGALLTVGALAGCTSNAGSSSSAGGSGGSVAAGNANGSASAADAAAKAPDRSIVTTGYLDLVSADPIGTAHAIGTIVAGDGGRVQTLNERPKGQASADLTVRIPSAVFDSTLTSIERHGKVRSVSIRSADVTAQVTDRAVRIANLRTSITRLRTLLAEATDAAALVEIESSLTTRETDLEQQLAQQKDLADQVSYATLGITVESPVVVRAAGPTDFLAGFIAGLTGLARTVAVLAVVAGVVLPWVVAVGLIGLVAWWVLRRVRRRTTPAPEA